MKKIIFLFVFICIYHISYSQRIEINKTKSQDYSIVVEGYTAEPLYLGCTAIIDNTREIDFDVKKVNGNFSETFTVSGDLIGRIIAGDVNVKWVTSLWKKKVSKCGCEYCKKNGYHMEGRVLSDTW